MAKNKKESYQEIKNFIDNWILENNKEGIKIPLVIKDVGITTDLVSNFEGYVYRIESVPPNERKDSIICENAKFHLRKIKEALILGNHNISKYGWKEFNNFPMKK